MKTTKNDSKFGKGRIYYTTGGKDFDFTKKEAKNDSTAEIDKFVGSPKAIVVSIMGKDYLVSAPNGEPNDFEQTLKDYLDQALQAQREEIIGWLQTQLLIVFGDLQLDIIKVEDLEGIINKKLDKLK